MSDSRRKHAPPKEFRRRRPKHKAATLKTDKQRRAADRRAWRKDIT